MRNKYYIEDDKVKIVLRSKKNGDMICTVDKKDLQKLLELDVVWFPRLSFNAKQFYVMANNKPNKPLYIHRYLMNAKDGEYVDHIDHDPMNNCRDNLRIATNADNNKHRKGINCNNSSGFRNVSHDGRGNPIVQLQDKEGKNHVWRGFKSFEAAGLFAEEMRQKFYGEFSGESD